MKKINELTEQEILDLTEGQIQNMIRFEAAEQGIKLLPYPTRPTYKAIPTPTKKVYSLSGLYSIAFSDISIPQQIQEIIKSATERFSIEYKNDFYSYKYMKKSSAKVDEIKIDEVYEESQIESVLADLKGNTDLKKQYDSALTDYNENQGGIDAISKEIYDVIWAIREKYDTLSRYCGLYKNDYLPLANNDKTVAMNFLVKAYGLTEEQQQYVSENYTKLNN